MVTDRKIIDSPWLHTSQTYWFCWLFHLVTHCAIQLCLVSRRIYRGAVNLVLFRRCPSRIFWKCTIWNMNFQYKNDWYTLKLLTKPIFCILTLKIFTAPLILLCRWGHQRLSCIILYFTWILCISQWLWSAS